MILWHRRMAVLAFIAVMIWGWSGLLHPLMTWTNPRPIAFMPPASAPAHVPDKAFLERVVREHAPDGFTGLRVIGDVVQIALREQGERLYIGRDGARIDDADRAHAIDVARYYTGLRDANVKDAQLITSFSNQYTYVNRYLPVWKISFDDARGMSVYVDTATDRLGAITDRRKVILQTLFQTLHTGQWLDAAEPLRLILIAVMVGLALSVSVAGLYMLVRMRGPRKGARKLHRIVAYGALLPLLMFPVSGLFHLFVHSPLVYKTPESSPYVFGVQDLKFIESGMVRDARLVLPGWWRVEDESGVTYTRLYDGLVVRDEEAFLRAIVPDIKGSVTKITSFTDEYGFAYKRLPVWRAVQGDDVVFIEAKTGVVAARVSTMKRAESWTFSRLHKWQFLDGVSAKISGPGPFKTAFRDAVMVGFVMLALALAMIGFLLSRRR